MPLRLTLQQYPIVALAPDGRWSRTVVAAGMGLSQEMLEEEALARTRAAGVYAPLFDVLGSAHLEVVVTVSDSTSAHAAAFPGSGVLVEWRFSYLKSLVDEFGYRRWDDDMGAGADFLA